MSQNQQKNLGSRIFGKCSWFFKVFFPRFWPFFDVFGYISIYRDGIFNFLLHSFLLHIRVTQESPKKILVLVLLEGAIGYQSFMQSGLMAVFGPFLAFWAYFHPRTQNLLLFTAQLLISYVCASESTTKILGLDLSKGAIGLQSFTKSGFLTIFGPFLTFSLEDIESFFLLHSY